MKRIVLCVLALFLVVVSGQSPAHAQSSGSSGLEIKVSGPSETVFNWEKDRCKDWMFPDAPARAFVNDQDQVILLAADNSNWVMRGTSLNGVRVSCGSTFLADKSQESQAFNSNGWIEATFTDKGKTVVALVSNDWSPAAHGKNSGADDVCPRSAPDTCHYMAITLVVSSDGGGKFAYPKDAHLVAAKPISDLNDEHHMVGFATASNMFSDQGFVYALLGVRSKDVKHSGSCLFRSKQGTDLTQWEYWDGKSFLKSAAGDAAREEQQASASRCAPMTVPFDKPVEFRSVSYWSDCRCYIGMFEGARNSPGSGVTSGFFFSTSTDLLSWTPPKLVMKRPLNSECQEILVYPSLLDPKASTRNFGDVTDRPYLYFTRFNRTSCKGTPDRDLVRVPLSLALSH